MDRFDIVGIWMVFQEFFFNNHSLCFQVRHIGFSTGWGSVGEFKIWKKEDSDENHNEAFTLGVPHNMVPGSERATAYMIGTVVLLYGKDLSVVSRPVRFGFYL